MKILLIEDDPVQADSLTLALSRAFEEVTVQRVATVAELEVYLSNLNSDDPPSLVILDGIVPWFRPAEHNVGGLRGVSTKSPYEGGRECLRMLAQNRISAEIPIIAYTILDKERMMGREGQVPRHVFHVRKTGGFDELIVFIRSVMLGEPKEGSKSIKEKFAGAIEAKPGWFGFSIDLKKLFDRSGESD